MFKNVKKWLTGVGVKMKERSPEIWLGTGIVLMVVDVIGAVGAGMKLKETIQPHYEVIKTRKKQVAECEKLETDDKALLEEYKGDLRREQSAFFKDIAFTFAPVIALNGAACFCFFRSVKILRNWNMGLVVAYNGILDAFTAYQTNNIAQNGDTAHQKALSGGEEIELTDPETNEIYKAIKCPYHSEADLYGRVFCEETSSLFSKYWRENPEEALNFLELVRIQAEDKRQRIGFISLSDVLIALGLPVQAYTYFHGWKDTPVSFGIEDFTEEGIKMYKLGKIPALHLQFNCDGLIIKEIDEYSLREACDR